MYIKACELTLGMVIDHPGFRITIEEISHIAGRVVIRSDGISLVFFESCLVHIPED